MTASHGPAASLAELMPFAQAVGLQLTEASPDRAVGRLDWAPERCTVGGAMHGGALMTLADSVAAACAYLHLPAGAATATVSASSHFFRPVRSGYAEATATPLHLGRSTIVVQTEVRDAEGRRVAHVTQTQAVLPAPPPATS
jgi:1,4-dihydroxy-2-naphthoyl-CoA hydrolase